MRFEPQIRGAGRRPGWPQILAAVLASVALIVGPVSASIRAACDLCPADCPMHRDDGVAKADQHDSARPHCHQMAGGKTETEQGQRWTRPPCRDRALFGALSIQPMVLPGPVAFCAIGPDQRVGPGLRFTCNAPSARPDTPPPQAFA